MPRAPISHLTKICEDREEKNDDSQQFSYPQISLEFPQTVLIGGVGCRSVQKSKSQRVHVVEGPDLQAKLLMEKLAFSCVKGLKPEMPNQDDWCAVSGSDFTVIGVFDGHGPFGHFVSDFVKINLISQLMTSPYFRSDPTKALKEAFVGSNESLLKHCQSAEAKTSPAISGCTATVVLLLDGTAYLAHVGDSRAMICSTHEGHLRLKYVTEDHKPLRPDELSRIQQSNGDVRQIDSEGISRLFLKGKNFPGIAVSRAIGDSIAATVGLTCEPEVAAVAIDDEDSFILVASDGIWEFLSEPDILSEIEAQTFNSAPSALVEASWNLWMNHENMSDDMTVVMLALSQITSSAAVSRPSC